MRSDLSPSQGEKCQNVLRHYYCSFIFCRFCFVFVLFVDYSSDLFPSSRPRMYRIGNRVWAWNWNFDILGIQQIQPSFTNEKIVLG